MKKQVFFLVSCFVFLISFGSPLYAKDFQPATTDLDSLRRQAEAEFGELTGVNMVAEKGHLTLSGEVVEAKDYRRIEEFARANSKVINRVHLSEKGISRLSNEIQTQIDSDGVRVKPLRDKLILEGSVYNPNEAASAQKIAESYGEPVVNLIDVRGDGRQLREKRMIKVDVHMMEIKKQAIRSLGIQWAPGATPKGESINSVSGGGGMLGSLGNLANSLIGIIFNLVPKLNFIRQRGDGRVLENPQLIVKNGDSGEFFSGTEIPYYNKGELNFKQAGVKLNVQPIIHGDTVDFKIDAMLSAPSANIEGGIDTHTVKTSAVCQFGESIVLANLSRAVDRKMKNRLPRDLDTSSALFALALSKDFQGGESEFVIFLTPHLVVSGEKGNSYLKKWEQGRNDIRREVLPKKEYEEYLGSLGVKNNGNAGLNEGIKKRRINNRKR